MRQAYLIILCFGLADIGRCHAAAPRLPHITIIDATGAFWNFWNDSSRSADERVQAFFDKVVAPHPDLFNADVLGSADLSAGAADPQTRRQVAAYLNDVAPLISQMRIISESILRDLTRYTHDFASTFPDYAPSAPVYFTVSLFQFDGATRPVRGQTALLFGIDEIARLYGAAANFNVLFDHELFHQYHDQIAPELTDDAAPLWASLWEEGLATFVSQKMNPGSTEADVLGFPRDLATLARPKLPALARELLANLDSTDKKEYAAFFMGGNGRPGLPNRSGYYVGYRIAVKLSSGRSLRELAALRGPELKAAVQRALNELARSR